MANIVYWLMFAVLYGLLTFTIHYPSFALFGATRHHHQVYLTYIDMK